RPLARHLRSALHPRASIVASAAIVAAVSVGCSRGPGEGAAGDAPEAQPGSGASGVSGLGRPTPVPVPAGAGSGQPHLALGPGGQAVLSWLEPTGERGQALKFSRFEAGDWSAPEEVAAGENLLVNWADFPSVEPITADTWIAHWLRMAPDSFASYDVSYSVSRDGGQTWSEPALLNDDGYLTEHGFVSLFPWGDAIGAVWLDGRRIAEQFEQGEFDPEAPPVGMSLRYARIGYDGAVRERGELDELACDCCQTDAAVAADGPVVVYRDRTPAEIRDNVVLRYADGAWQPAVTLGPDGWHIEGCPVNGPAVAARGDDVVAAWFTAPGNAPKTRFARSTDGGATFGPPVEIDGAGSFGHVDVALLQDGGAAVSWWRRAEAGRTQLAARRIEPDGTLGEIVTVASNAAAQPVDVPQMIETGGELLFAWTDAAQNTVRTASVSLSPPR
ncbi:MAG: hypothetical protein JXB36_05260, partial [Gammaproteobacteria bacterium]|nr:hypothetical protein [Gammaproteobacteria bacterium]